MSTSNEAFRKAANSPQARQAAETAKSIGEEIGDFAGDVGRMASKQYGRAQDMAGDVYEELHEASVRNPHLTLAIAAGLGFLLGVVVASRR
jgi:ElaB/YqjD/DUF883 family membrane-anchored ribosome-binding protein